MKRILFLLIIVFGLLGFTFSGCASKQVTLKIDDISYEPTNPVEGDLITFKVKIDNTSNVTLSETKFTTMGLYIDDKNFTTENIPIPVAGNYEMFPFTEKWQALEGCHNIKVVINPNNVIKESDSSNNTKVIELCVENEPVWRQIADSPIHSSPALYQGDIFIASEGNMLYCLNSENGDLVWEKSVGIAYNNEKVSGLYSSQVVSDGKVYIHAYNRDSKGQLSAYLICLSADNGNLLWKQLVFAVPNDFPSMPYSGSTPAVYNEKVYLISREYLYCFNANDGKLIWKYATNSPIDSSPAFYQGKIYASLQGIDYIGCFDAENGKLLWKYRIGEKLDFLPMFYTTAYNEKVYVCTPSNGIYCLDAENGNLLWQKDNIRSNTSPEVYENRLYVGAGGIYCFNADSGDSIWHYVLTNDFLQSPLTIIDGKIYFGSAYGTLYCIDADKGTLLWSYKTQKTIWSKPLIYQGKVYFGADSYVYCISVYNN
ncbi:MAG: hypothetical protein COZ65_01435 [Caldiserica bacterium CG_4_8_14_3_um_filter_35_18]|nr:MAG: hypothetical protein COZ65_01435 [Caldiserica bacterium CG_4_8_14_3_um_filter_35_18]